MMKKLIVMLMILTICALTAACTDDNAVNSMMPSDNVASPSSIIPETSPSATHATDEVRVTETASATNNGL